MTWGGKGLTPAQHDPRAINAPERGTKAGTQHIKRHGPKRHIVQRRVSARQIYRALVSVRIDGCSPSGLPPDVRINGVRLGRPRRVLPPTPATDPTRPTVLPSNQPPRSPPPTPDTRDQPPPPPD